MYSYSNTICIYVRMSYIYTHYIGCLLTQYTPFYTFRMVYAMWSSLDKEHATSIQQQTGENYSTMKKVSSGNIIQQSLSVSDDKSPVEVRGVDEIMPEATAAESQLIHREHDHTDVEHQEEQQQETTEMESLLDHGHDLVDRGHDKSRPVLEQTSIVGQSREAYGTQASIYTSFLMVASALCLGLAQMVRILDTLYALKL